MLPAVMGSRPLTMRMRVDLPEPDRPMTTKISPLSTSKEVSMTAAVCPDFLSWSRVLPALSFLTPSDGRRPKTL